MSVINNMTYYYAATIRKDGEITFEIFYKHGIDSEAKWIINKNKYDGKVDVTDDSTWTYVELEV